MKTDINVSESMVDDLARFGPIVRKHHPIGFKLADNISKLGLVALRNAPPTNDPDVRLAWQTYAKGLQAFRSALLLIEAGSVGEAAALVRVCTESVIVGTALARKNLTFGKLLEANDNHWKPLAEEVAKRTKSLTGENTAEKEVAKLAEIYPPGSGPYAFRVEQLARAVDLIDLYTIGFRYPSNMGAHVTLDALLMHHSVVEGESGLRFGPTDQRANSVLVLLNFVGAFLLGFAAEDLGMSEIKEAAQAAKQAALSQLPPLPDGVQGKCE